MRHAMWLVLVALALTVSAASAETVIGMGMFGGVGIPSGDVTDAAKDSKTGAQKATEVDSASNVLVGG